MQLSALKSSEVIGELTVNHPLLEGKEEFDPRMKVPGDLVEEL